MQKDIKCPQCGTLFGKAVAIEGDLLENAILTIKNRDLYRSYKGGKVWGPCRGCGVTVQWPQTED